MPRSPGPNLGIAHTAISQGSPSKFTQVKALGVLFHIKMQLGVGHVLLQSSVWLKTPL